MRIFESLGWKDGSEAKRVVTQAAHNELPLRTFLWPVGMRAHTTHTRVPSHRETHTHKHTKMIAINLAHLFHEKC